MSSAERLADLGRLLEQDRRFEFIAQQTVAQLSAMTESELDALRDDEIARDQVFQGIWDDFVEPADRGDADMAFKTWQMAFEGVVIAHVIGLWTAGPVWRDRAQALIPPADG